MNVEGLTTLRWEQGKKYQRMNWEVVKYKSDLNYLMAGVTITRGKMNANIREYRSSRSGSTQPWRHIIFVQFLAEGGNMCVQEASWPDIKRVIGPSVRQSINDICTTRSSRFTMNDIYIYLYNQVKPRVYNNALAYFDRSINKQKAITINPLGYLKGVVLGSIWLVLTLLNLQCNIVDEFFSRILYRTIASISGFSSHTVFLHQQNNCCSPVG